MYVELIISINIFCIHFFDQEPKKENNLKILNYS